MAESIPASGPRRIVHVARPVPCVAALVLAASVPACLSARPDPLPPPGVVLPSDDAGCPANPLRARLDAGGTVRVIVVLEVAAEGSRAITEAQDRILAELDGTHVRLVRRFRYAAQLALLVDERALCRLLTSPRVRSVSEDEAVGPLRGAVLPGVRLDLAQQPARAAPPSRIRNSSKRWHNANYTLQANHAAVVEVVIPTDGWAPAPGRGGVPDLPRKPVKFDPHCLPGRHPGRSPLGRG